MNPIEHLAFRLVDTVIHYPYLFTSEMHAGVDLARAMITGDVPVTPDVTIALTIGHAYRLLEAQAALHWGEDTSGFQPYLPAWPAATDSARNWAQA